jgi:hypothetical protein
MKRVLVALAACAAIGAWGQTTERQKSNAVQAPAHFDFEAVQRFIDAQPKPPPKPTLGPIDQWRYESCQKEAAQAPTQFGVTTGLRLCREKFGQ